MPSLTVLAPDSALAMEMVMKELGPDAFILSTTQRDGQIEICATNDPIPQTSRPVSAARRNFGALLAAHAERAEPVLSPLAGRQPLPPRSTPGAGAEPAAPMAALSAAREAARIAAAPPRPPESTGPERAASAPAGAPPTEAGLQALEGTLRGLIESMQVGVMAGAGAAVDTSSHPVALLLGRAGFSPRLIAELRITFEAAPDAATGRTAFVEAVAARLAPPEVQDLTRARVILVAGPSGSGKSMLAARLAAHLATSGITPRLVEIAPAALGAGERLRIWARMLGLPVRRWDIAHPPAVAGIGEGPAIVDLPSNPELARRLVERLLAVMPPGALQLLIALPGGASRHLVTTTCTAYAGLDPTLVLTRLDECDITANELSAIAELQVPLGWMAAGEGLAQALVPITRAVLVQHIAQWLPAA
ncbi:hypothetical protein ACFQXB_05325 [Plastorhodobacter daqingensis]|uniref:SRP54-type proteins GTP-binding domain-containing protein n=1 Tax=Plastorhodobacter daqingensis TaxID=1387281 RepID=A0ABW2UI40_9RHOB